MRKTILAVMAAVAMFGVACQDNEIARERDHKLGDARPDDGREGFFENDGKNDNLESDDEGIGGSGDLDSNDPVDVNTDEEGKVKVDIDTDRE